MLEVNSQLEGKLQFHVLQDNTHPAPKHSSPNSRQNLRIDNITLGMEMERKFARSMNLILDLVLAISVCPLSVLVSKGCRGSEVQI